METSPYNPVDEGVIAAIATALFEMTEDWHDITIQKVTRRNSPWNSKTCGLRHAISYNRLLRSSQ